MATKVKDRLAVRPPTKKSVTKSEQSSRVIPKEKVAATQSKPQYDLPTSIQLRLSYLFGNQDHLVQAWLDTPHPELGERSPNSLVQEGRLDLIDSLIEAAESGYLG